MGYDDGTSWEYAEVTVELASWWRPWYCRFWLDVVSPTEGAYNGGVSDTMAAHEFDGRAARRYLEAFVAVLVSDGWEPQPQRGSEWYSYRLAHRVASQGPLRLAARRDGS